MIAPDALIILLAEVLVRYKEDVFLVANTMGNLKIEVAKEYKGYIDLSYGTVEWLNASEELEDK